MTAAGGGSVLHPVGAPAGVAVSGCGGFPADRVRGQPRGGQAVPHITGSDCSRLSYSSQNNNSQVKPTFSSSFYFRRWDDFCCISITSTVEKNCLKTNRKHKTHTKKKTQERRRRAWGEVCGEG